METPAAVMDATVDALLLNQAGCVPEVALQQKTHALSVLQAGTKTTQQRQQPE